jgi:hypothetical protein
MSSHRRSRHVGRLLEEINRTLAVIEANGQMGSVAHQRLLQQKQQLLGLGGSSKRPEAAPAEAKSKEKKTPTFTPWIEEAASAESYPTEPMPKVARCKRCGHLFNYSAWSEETTECLSVTPWHKLQEKPHGSILTGPKGVN